MRYLLLIALWCSSTFAYAQSVRDYTNITLEKDEHYNEAVNNAALETANYLLAVPYDDDDLMQVKARMFLIKWMSGSPDYSFSVGNTFVKVAETHKLLGAIYMAAMVKCQMENKADKDNADATTLCATQQTIAYAMNKKNKVKPKKELQKMIDANEEGTLAEYIKSIEVIE